MDGKHVGIRCPANSGSQFFNYKETFSIILLAVVDAKYNLLYIDVGTNGRVNDAHVFSKSTFYEALNRSRLNLPPEAVFVGDDAFPLRRDLLRPYSRSRQLSQTQKVFNYRLSRARRCVENAFGLLVARFRIFDKPIPVTVSTTEKIVRTCCTLHNLLLKTSPTHADGVGNDSTQPSFSIGSQRPIFTNPGLSPSGVRGEYAERFMSTNSVPWQWDMI